MCICICLLSCYLLHISLTGLMSGITYPFFLEVVEKADYIHTVLAFFYTLSSSLSLSLAVSLFYMCPNEIAHREEVKKLNIS